MPRRISRVWQRIKSPFRKVNAFLNNEPEERPFVDALSDSVKSPSVLFEHIEALRKHLLRALLVTAVTVAVSLRFTNQLMAFLAKPVGGIDNLQAIQVTENIGVFMKVGLFTGIAIAVPYIAFELYLFAAPGLSVRSRRYGLLGIPFAALFFFGGIAFAYYFMLPTALPFLLDFSGIPAHPSANSYYGFITNLLFWIGVAFEFPLVIFVLSAMGLVKPGMLLRQWRLAIVIIAIVAAVITPTVDPINMSLVMAPMIVLYFFSILLSSIAQAGSRKPKQVENNPVDQEE
jgi:sec-independent protein translocase protein TatC